MRGAIELADLPDLIRRRRTRRQGRQGIRAPAGPAGYVDGSSACQSSRFSRLSALRRPDAAVGAAISREAPPGLTRGVSSPYQELPVEVGNGFPTRLAPGYRGEVTNRPRLPDEVREVERSAKGSGDCIPARVTKARQPCRAFSRSGLGRLQPPPRGRASICRVFSHVPVRRCAQVCMPRLSMGRHASPLPESLLQGLGGIVSIWARSGTPSSRPASPPGRLRLARARIADLKMHGRLAPGEAPSASSVLHGRGER